MDERAIIEATDAPRTRASLAADLRELGVVAGGVALVHTRMSALGWVCGGAVAVAGALLDAVGPDGTIVVPTQTTGNSDPAGWSKPPVPATWWPTIRQAMPAYDARTTPSALGAVPEVLRTWPGARRSDHPQVSFAAVGPHAAPITAGHVLDSALGEGSPLARLYELDGWILLLGAAHDTNTSLHLAEHRVPSPPQEQPSAAVRGADGRRTWTTWEDVATDSTDFDALGAAFDATGAVLRGQVGSAACRLMRQRAAVDFAIGWLQANR
jgi:aminoglycoside 3-N-acetyltransferase